MLRLLTLALLTSALFSCGNAKKLKIEEIETLVLDYDSERPNNYGQAFTGGVCAKMKTGELRCLKNDTDLTYDGNVVLDIDDQKIQVVRVPANYTDSVIPVTLQLTDKKGNFVQGIDSLRLNFRSGITLSGIRFAGMNGSNGSNGGQRWIGRDGKDGDAGAAGTNGSDGEDHLVYIWKEGTAYYIYVENSARTQIGHYQIRGSQPFRLDVSGGTGGNGGNGGDGSDGKNGELVDQKEKLPGDGGDGGAAGMGGRGGNGGRIRCVLHPSAADFRENLQLTSNGGSAGKNGEPGKAGKAGTKLANQNSARDGVGGTRPGMTPQRGFNGEVIIVEETFDPAQYK